MFAGFPAGKSPDVSGAAALGAAGVRTNEKEDAEVDERLFAHFNKPSDGGLEGKPPPGVTLLEAEFELTEGAEVEFVLKAGAGVGTVLPGGVQNVKQVLAPIFQQRILHSLALPKTSTLHYRNFHVKHLHMMMYYFKHYPCIIQNR